MYLISAKKLNHENNPSGNHLFFVLWNIVFQQILPTIFACACHLDMIDEMVHLQRQLIFLPDKR